MIISKGDKVHVIMRRTFENQVRRHFTGEIDEADGAVVKATGFVFIYDEAKAHYIRKPTERTTVLDLSESGYIVNLLSRAVAIADLKYETIDRSYMAVVDSHGFSLDVNEFGVKR